MRSIAEIWEAVKGVFTDFQWPFVVAAVFFFVIIYYVFRTLAENNAKKLIPAYVFLVVCAGVHTLFTEAGATLFILAIMLMSLFFLLLFSVEIKRSVWKKHKIVPTETKQMSKTTGGAVRTVRAEENITNIVKAVQSLSKANIGALIVLSNGNLPREIIESGVTLNSSISSQLIEGIFIPKAPLHDGAMIINGDKIQAAGCFLPLTQKEFPKNYGTRHRAGIGVTEVADVSAIIVSEETGIVSYVKRGDITRFVDSENLKRFLRDYYWKDLYKEVKSK